jgi:signal transduction histidine kinase
VFHNLFENAHHAMKGEGTISVSTRLNGKHVIISVHDTGNGVAAEHQERLFEPFFTTKDKGEGTGIGLVICRDLIERSGGQITFESTENCGTTFHILLPYQDSN